MKGVNFKKENISFSLPSFLQIEEELQKVDSNSIKPELSALDWMASREEREEKDFDSIKGLYPKGMRELLEFVEDVCDRMEYKGSMMYDEYPDKISVQRICDSFCGEKKGEQGMGENWLMEDVLRVLLLQEMYHRRCRYRRRSELFGGGERE